MADSMSRSERVKMTFGDTFSKFSETNLPQLRSVTALMLQARYAITSPRLLRQTGVACTAGKSVGAIFAKNVPGLLMPWL